MSVQKQKKVTLGRISSPFGVRGWLKVFSYTRPLTNILDYSPWQLQQNGQVQSVNLIAGKKHGKGIIVQLENCADRDLALQFVGADIIIDREALPPAETDEYYWSDLIGLTVFNLEGVNLGQVQQIVETGANDVLVLKGERERLIPFRNQVVQKIDLAQGIIKVDWDASF